MNKPGKFEKDLHSKLGEFDSGKEFSLKKLRIEIVELSFFGKAA